MASFGQTRKEPFEASGATPPAISYLAYHQIPARKYGKISINCPARSASEWSFDLICKFKLPVKLLFVKLARSCCPGWAPKDTTQNQYCNQDVTCWGGKGVNKVIHRDALLWKCDRSIKKILMLKTLIFDFQVDFCSGKLENLVGVVWKKIVNLWGWLTYRLLEWTPPFLASKSY